MTTHFLRPMIAAKLLEKEAIDLSDTELHRCLDGVVAPTVVLAEAMQMRLDGVTMDELPIIADPAPLPIVVDRMVHAEQEEDLPGIPQGMSEEQLREIERGFVAYLGADTDFACQRELVAEVRRLRQREADLETSSNLWEGLYKEVTNHIRKEAYMDGWHDCEEHQQGEYARGVRVP